MAEENKRKRAAQEILKSGRNRVYLDLRFMEQALFLLTPEENQQIFWGSDGEKLFYEEEYLLKRFLRSPGSIGCDYLHTVIHCLYQHPFQAGQCEERYWNLAADIAVADVMGEVEAVWISGQIPEACSGIVEKIKEEVPLMSAAHIVKYLQRVFSNCESLYGYTCAELEELFQRDSHECWYGKREKSDEKKRRLSEEWKGAAETVAMQAQGFSRGQGNMPAGMLMNLQKLVREKYDYGEFLRKFAVLNERMKVNLDEFDYTYYLYGLRILKKVPLIEPLEYKEEHQIREFAIVIDTSGSCSEGLAQRFLIKTYNILKQTEQFSERAVLHVIQCDAVVQEDVKIDSLERLEEYIGTLELKGGGGTDFRPAFAYVDELCRKKEFQRLCGLIYFTDGYGIFPKEPPDYKTAFVFVERDDHVRVPPWAIRLYLENEDV